MHEIAVLDPRFRKLIIPHAKVERLHAGCRWTEGPAYFPAGRYLLWSDIPNDRLMRYDETSGIVSVFMQPCGSHNGHTVDPQGRLVSCEHRNRRVSRIEHDGSITTLASHWEGRRLNSPNDVVIKSDGAVWFTDPTYGIDNDYEGDAAPSEIGASNVYRIDPASGAVERVIDDRVQPNGLAFSPDEALLYVVDTGGSHVPGLPSTIHAYRVSADGRRAGEPTLVATCPDGSYDGLRADVDGNIWAAAGNSVHCHAPDGTLIGTIAIGEMVANLCFGGLKYNRLFICAQTSLYAIYLAARGVSPWRR
jgi:gluconolactonase